MNPYDLAPFFKNRDVSKFAHEILGMPTHEGQDYWFKHAWKPINILKPSNQWGKTTAEAIFHIFQAVCKPMLTKFNLDFRGWSEVRYETLNFGGQYEVAKGVSEAIQDIVSGKYMLADGTFNKSLLRGWAIVDVWDTPKLPQIVWWNRSLTLIRSYDSLGESFKRKKLAFLSGDECGDIDQLKLFVNGTLLPRCFFYEAPIHLVGTAQPKGVEYEELAEIAEEEFRINKFDSQYFIISPNINGEMASVYQNKFMPEERIKQIEAIADPELRKQIIYGQYVDWTNHLYTWEEVSHVFVDEIPYNAETGFSEAPIENEFYIFSVDMAAASDETSCTCLRYNIRKKKNDGTYEFFPDKVVFHKAWKGASLPLALQYEMIKQYYMQFKNVSPLRTKFVYDSGALGGKNAGQAFEELHGFPFPPKGRSYGEIKAEAMGKVKELLGRNRKFIIDDKGKQVDQNPNWGGLRASSKLSELRRQMEIASRDDDKIKNDQYTSLMMAVHFSEARVPKISHTKAVSYDMLKSTNY